MYLRSESPDWGAMPDCCAARAAMESNNNVNPSRRSFMRLLLAVEPANPKCWQLLGKTGWKMERETGFEPATSTLARSHSTAELLPLDFVIISKLAGTSNSRHLRARASSSAPGAVVFAVIPLRTSHRSL